ncbi:MAG TPA: hypothetical protein VGN63_22885 [Flavisolibacter sp.]|nr:hypothetical protein [Flavisolibacter sp.]
MTNKNDITTAQVHTAPLGKRMLQGAGIALVLISIFLYGTGEPNPEWPKFWMIKPLLIVPIAGALGGVFYYFMDHLRYQGGWIKVLAILLSLFGYLIALWLGTVLGLNGTMWD